MNQLNPPQQEAVKYIDGPLLVLAGAGSGKTSVITRKIAWLIEKCGIDARNITAVTFTNKASREMRDRVGKLIAGDKAKGLTVSTFHTLGLNIIRKEHKTLGYASGFSIFDSDDTQALIRDLLIQSHGSDGDQAEPILRRISAWKNDMVAPQQALADAENPVDVLHAQAFIKYQEALKAYNAVDFDDLIALPSALFSSEPDILERWQNRIRYLLVDEYQDTNTAQYQLVRQLVGLRGGLTVVGDDDQSIYSWRGAQPENLALLQSDFPHLKVIKLEQNYRSSKLILRSANTVIGNNPHVFEKALWSQLPEGDQIRIIRCASDDDECERVINEIAHQKMIFGGRYSDFAILYRGNHQARPLELKLQQNQIPYHLSGGTSFFARSEIKDVMSYLRLLLNPDDDNAFLRVINVPRRKIGTSTLQALGEYANERGCRFYAACDELGLESKLPAAAVARLREFTHWLDGMRRECYEGDAIATVKQLLTDIDYFEWLIQNSSSTAVAESRLANVMTLIDSMARSMEKNEESDIEEAIRRLVLRDLLEKQQEEGAELDQVQLMTLHAAKGLEFPNVFIVGMEEEILPHRNSMEENGIEEERRLFYVGITRAQKKLTLTWCGKRQRYGESSGCEPSRFLDELPKADVLWEGRPGDVADNEARGTEALAGLKGMFD